MRFRKHFQPLMTLRQVPEHATRPFLRKCADSCFLPDLSLLATSKLSRLPAGFLRQRRLCVILALSDSPWSETSKAHCYQKNEVKCPLIFFTPGLTIRTNKRPAIFYCVKLTTLHLEHTCQMAPQEHHIAIQKSGHHEVDV
jgi:hypothetical protein